MSWDVCLPHKKKLINDEISDETKKTPIVHMETVNIFRMCNVTIFRQTNIKTS